MNCTCSNEKFAENDLKEFNLANNYSHVISWLKLIEILQLDIIQLINDESILKIKIYSKIQSKICKNFHQIDF